MHRTPSPFLLSAASVLLAVSAPAQEPAAGSPAEPPVQLEALDDAALEARFRAAGDFSYLGTGGHDAYLLEMVRRGGARWDAFLAAELERRRDVPPPDEQGRVSVPVDLEVFTALRRVRGEPDPLEVELSLDPAPSAPEAGGALLLEFPELPTLAVRLRNVSAEPFGLTIGGEYRSGRLARWRVEVRDGEGRLHAPPTWPLGIGGGISTRSLLAPGEAWGRYDHELADGTPAPLELLFTDYAELPGEGSFDVRVLYHDQGPIADVEELGAFVVHASREARVGWRPRTVRLEPTDRARVRALLGRVWAEEERVLLVAVPAWRTEFVVDAEGPAAELVALGWVALPELLDTLAEPELGARERAHVLGLLYTLTGLVNPRVERKMLGRFRVPPVSKSTGSGALSIGPWKGDDGGPERERQEPYVERWRRFAGLVRAVPQ